MTAPADYDDLRTAAQVHRQQMLDNYDRLGPRGKMLMLHYSISLVHLDGALSGTQPSSRTNLGAR